MIFSLVFGCSGVSEDYEMIETNIPTNVTERDIPQEVIEQDSVIDCDYSTVPLDDIYDYSKIDFSILKWSFVVLKSIFHSKE